ncbi:MAG: zinc ABC transporter substrate-binding protein [Hyphomicrobiaceae bacterium]|nr:zinc ABC transporter substrate-binding protein [Hyphomicrobiaceae bacterium]
MTRYGLFAALLATAILSMHAAYAEERTAPEVVVTIKPVHALVAMVMEGIAIPGLLVEGKASPHSFSLRPSDAHALAGADVFVRVSPSVEPFTVRLAETLPSKTKLVTLAETPGLHLLKLRTGTAFEAHEHGDHGDHEGAHEHSKDHDGAVAEKREEDHEHGHEHDADGVDGHIWLDPDNAKAIVLHVADTLASLRPDLKEKLDANAARAVAKIAALDAELQPALSAAKGKPFIVFHDAYQYFESHYGMRAAGAITLNPEVKPSARRLSEIRATLKATGARCVFAEPQFSPRIVATVIEGTAAKAGTLDPLGVDIAPGPGQYEQMMRAISKSMTECLGG